MLNQEANQSHENFNAYVHEFDWTGPCFTVRVDIGFAYCTYVDVTTKDAETVECSEGGCRAFTHRADAQALADKLNRERRIPDPENWTKIRKAV